MNIDAGAVAAVVAGFNIVVTLVGGGVAWGKITGRMDARDADIKRTEDDMHEMKALLVSSAVEADRLRRAEADIDNIETDVRNLRRGIGWINDEKAHGVNREY